MSKSYIRASRANGSTKAKVERLLRLGWEPGKAVGPLSRKAVRCAR